jgi:mannose-6-phosphate isomerase-like protein (cupin superfamily)
MLTTNHFIFDVEKKKANPNPTGKDLYLICVTVPEEPSEDDDEDEEDVKQN